MIYYFAYGSNMNHAHMKQLCPSSVFIKPAYLEEYAFTFDKDPDALQGALANIVHAKRSVVWGGLYGIDDQDIPALDQYEESPRLYQKRIIKVKDAEDFVYDALCYIRAKRIKGVPQETYLSLIVQGAHDCRLPEEYIQETLHA